MKCTITLLALLLSQTIVADTVPARARDLGIPYGSIASNGSGDIFIAFSTANDD